MKESLEMPGPGMFKAKVWEYTNSRSSRKSSCVMYVDMNVKFEFGQRVNGNFTAGGWKKEETTQFTSEWQSAVKTLWSQRFRLELMKGSRSACKCPCGTDVVIKTRIDYSGKPGGRESGQWIVRVVKEKTGGSQVGGAEVWLYEGDNEPRGKKGHVVSAHECGHMLGLLDEYPEATVRAKSAALNEKDNIMWHGMDVRSQQYVIFSEILNEKLGKGNGCKYGVRDADGQWYTKDNAGLEAGWVMGVPK